MTDARPSPRPSPLLIQLLWFIRLRWVAGLAVIAAALVDQFSLGWYDKDIAILIVGGAILAYNVVIWRLLTLLRDWKRHRRMLHGLAWFQILADLACLSALTVWTGGTASPLLGLFVLHMVFASLLLRRYVAYSSAAVAAVMLAIGLWQSGQWPDQRASWLAAVGWFVTLLLTVHLANRITGSLRRQRRRLVAKNRRIRAMDDQLRQQQEAMIQHEKTAAMGQMAAGVAHEIANPVASIDSILQLMLRNDRHLTKDNVVTMRQQVQRINRIVEQLTSFAHPTELDWQAVPVDELVATALAMVRFDRRHRHVHTEQDLNRPCCQVRVQPHAVQQVLVNLLLNAFDAVAEAPEPRVVIRSHCADSECRISIIDNGHGIAPKQLDRIFDPFFTTKPVGKGTGLGLSISRKLVANQGGRLEAASEPGRGASFAIVLPHFTAASRDRETGSADIPSPEKPSD